MKKQYYEEFVALLEKIFGSFNERRKRFKKASNSKIARELCYSDSQFSRLINESASEGEYQRAIRNTKRMLNEMRLQEKVSEDHIAGEASFLSWFSLPYKKLSLPLIFAPLIVFLVIIVAANWGKENSSSKKQGDRDDMLQWIFESSTVSPYLQLSDLPQDCSYSCYKYQGQWKLKDPYKIPFFRERNGFHYLAKNVNLYTRCNTEQTNIGNILEGYEYQEHEIWYDKRELQIDSFLVATDKTKIRDNYRNMQFKEDTNYVKVAKVHTFFRNEFRIDSSSIDRSGMVVGRDVEFLAEDKLLAGLGSPSMVEEIKNEINIISMNRLEDFSRPVSCKASPLPDQNYHNITEADTMSFDCRLTTSNAPIQYTKTYILNDQYIETTCRPRSNEFSSSFSGSPGEKR